MLLIAMIRRAITIEIVIEKRSHELMYKTDRKRKQRGYNLDRILELSVLSFLFFSSPPLTIKF